MNTWYAPYVASFARKLQRRVVFDELGELVEASESARREPHPLGDVFDAEAMLRGDVAGQLAIQGWNLQLSSRRCAQAVHWYLRAAIDPRVELDQYERWRRLDQLKEHLVKETRSSGRVNRIIVPGTTIHLCWHSVAIRGCRLLSVTRRLLEADK